MPARAMLALMTAVLLPGCHSMPQPAPQTEVTYGGDREAPPQQIPDDWPITKAQYALIGWDTASKLLDPQAIEAAGFHSRKEIVAFAYRLLQMDYAPIARVMGGSNEGEDRGAAYEILGHYGSLEDARKHFDAVKAIDGNQYEHENVNQMILMHYMIKSLGYYLMRDHFMPQKENDLIQQIEDYLYQCSEINASSCWPYEGIETPNDYLREYARAAVNLGCSQRAQSRAQENASQLKGSLYELYGSDDLAFIERTEAKADRIKNQLPPVLPEEEIDQ